MIDALDDVLASERRRLTFVVVMPGYVGAHNTTVVLREEWRNDAGLLELTSYRFEYLREPRGTGRRAHHLHPLPGGSAGSHAHCEDPRPLHMHYRDVEVTLLEAADEFARIHTSGELRCADLFPLYV